MIVMKFGGTSVADPPAIRRLVEIVRGRSGERPLVVVSALARVSDTLLALPRLPASDRREGVSELLSRHEGVAAELGLPEEILAPLRSEALVLASALEELGDLPPPPELLDLVAGYGELWSSRLIVGALEAGGLPGAWTDIRPVMRTDDRHTRARPDEVGLPPRAEALFTPLLEGGRIPVTQGFLGSTPEGRPTTLGRGGSDYTASLLGAALKADRVEIWTDVDGIMSADPRVVPQARVLRMASHHEAAELAAFGAKVLHPATQAPLVEAGIPCVVLNSFAPEGAGTTVVSTSVRGVAGRASVRAISCKRGITVLNVRSPRMLGAAGFLRRLFEVFERHGVSVDVLATSEVSVSATVEEPLGMKALMADLEELGEVTLFPARAIVAVVGLALRDTSGVAARVFTAVKDINVEVISQGASALNVTFVVRDEDAVEAVRRLHRALIEEEEEAA